MSTNASFSCEQRQMKNASFFPVGDLTKDARWQWRGNETYLAVSLPPALLCYDTSNIWSALYVLKHPVFHRRKLPINKEGSCGLKAREEGL